MQAHSFLARFFASKVEAVAAAAAVESLDGVDRSGAGAGGGTASDRSADVSSGGSGAILGGAMSDRSARRARVRCFVLNKVAMRSERAGTAAAAARLACRLSLIDCQAFCRSRRSIAKRRTPTSIGSSNTANNSSHGHTGRVASGAAWVCAKASAGLSVTTCPLAANTN